MNEFGNAEDLNDKFDNKEDYSAHVPASLRYCKWDALSRAYDAYCIVRYLCQWYSNSLFVQLVAFRI